MKKSILILCAAFALVGCSQQGGGTNTGEQPSGGTSSSTAPSSTTNSNDQGAATAPGGANSGSATGTANTNK